MATDEFCKFAGLLSAALNMSANLENSAVAMGLEKVSFHSNPKESQCQKCSNYHTIALISHASKVMLKILQARLQQYVNHGIPDVQAGFRKGRGTRDQVANICWIIDNTRDFQKTSTSVLLTKSKSLCGLQQTVKNSQMGYQTM